MAIDFEVVVPDEKSIVIKHKGGESIPKGDWKYSITCGKDGITSFANQETDVKDKDLSVGTVLRAIRTTAHEESELNAPIQVGSYHLVIVHIPASRVILDRNVEVPPLGAPIPLPARDFIAEIDDLKIRVRALEAR